MRRHLLGILVFAAIATCAHAGKCYLVKDAETAGAGSYPGNFTKVDNALYFFANSGATGSELWKTNLLTNQTTFVKDLVTGSGDGDYSCVAFNHQLILAGPGSDNKSYGLWKSDGTISGTIFYKTMPDESGDAQRPSPTLGHDSHLTVCGSKIFFIVLDNLSQLWVTDGTADGTHVIKDAAPGPWNSLHVVGNRVFFIDGSDQELWASDGTDAGTVMVADLSEYQLTSLTACNGKVYFFAQNGQEIKGVWTSDGTKAGTKQLHAFKNVSHWGPPDMALWNNHVYFGVNNDLWQSDGTEAGTKIVKDFGPNPDVSNSGISTKIMTRFSPNSGVDLFYPQDHQLLFLGNTPETGTELWSTDGTLAGTKRLTDINPGPNSSFGNHSMMENPRYFPVVRVGSKILFIATDGTHDDMLWSMPVEGGPPSLVKNITIGARGLGPLEFYSTGNAAYFCGSDPAHGAELWKTDGTAAGTMLAADLNTGSEGSSPTNLCWCNGAVYYLANTVAKGLQLWKSDGTSGGTAILKEFPKDKTRFSDMTAAGSHLFFGAHYQIEDAQHHPGVPQNGNIVTLHGTYPGLMPPSTLTSYRHDIGEHNELWQSDGTASGTSLVKEIVNPAEFTAFDQRCLLFSAEDTAGDIKLWLSDGTEKGTVPINGGGNGSACDSPEKFTLLPGSTPPKFFFSANLGNTDSGQKNCQIAITDGTPSGTHFIKQINPSGPANPRNLTPYHRKMWFIADDGQHGDKLWSSDGTAAGTAMMLPPAASPLMPPAVPGRAGMILPTPMMVPPPLSPPVATGSARSMFFVPPPTFPTVPGSAPIIRETPLPTPAPNASTTNDSNPYAWNDPSSLCVCNDRLFFSAANDNKQYQLWSTDGTSSGIRLVCNLVSEADNLTACGNILFFFASGSDHERRLWKTDGTEAGTQMLTRFIVRMPQNGNNPDDKTEPHAVFHGIFYYPCDDGVHGTELWRSDGTTGGTYMVQDIFPGDGSSNPCNFLATPGALYFQATDPQHGAELWKMAF